MTFAVKTVILNQEQRKLNICMCSAQFLLSHTVQGHPPKLRKRCCTRQRAPQSREWCCPWLPLTPLNLGNGAVHGEPHPNLLNGAVYGRAPPPLQGIEVFMVPPAST